MSEAKDLFGYRAPPAQGSLFEDGALGAPAARGYVPDAEAIRRRLAAVLSRTRAAPGEPWPEREARLWQTVFPQMADWLPKAEADSMRTAFAREVERLAGS